MASRVCWYCSQVAHHAPLQEWAQYVASGEGELWMLAYACDACRAISVATALPADVQFDSDSNLSASSDPNLRRAAARYFESLRARITWLPSHGIGRRFEDVPTDIGQAASEAYSCYHIGSYRAAALLARAVVEAAAKDKGHVDGPLVAKIAAMEEARTINPSLADAAHEIRLIGNNMAHGDFMEAVSEEDCDDLLDFMSALLEEVYQRPTTLARRKQQREERRAQGRK